MGGSPNICRNDSSYISRKLYGNVNIGFIIILYMRLEPVYIYAYSASSQKLDADCLEHLPDVYVFVVVNHVSLCVWQMR